VIRRQLLLFGALLATAVFGLFVGAANLSLSEAWKGLASGLGLADTGGLAEAVVMEIRLPRIIGGILVGASLGVGGTGLQGVYRNPVAEPYLLGVSAAAGLGFVLGALVTRIGAVPVTPILLAGIAGALVALLTRKIAAVAPTGNGLVLAGVALGFAFLAWTLVVTFIVDSPRLPTFAYFVFGSLGTVTWPLVYVSLPVIITGILVIGSNARSLDLMSLGETQAMSLGVDVTRMTTFVLGTVGIIVGVSVAVAGVVGFVGLLAPLVGRRVVGPGHRNLITAAAVLGGLFVLWADILIRGLVGQVEVPLGVVTAAVGGPVLIIMLLRRNWT
jgi:iron complex transport system permease protein